MLPKASQTETRALPISYLRDATIDLVVINFPCVRTHGRLYTKL